ncbi:MAG: copper resistance protein NlpE [Dysgonomonas sp.]
MKGLRILTAVCITSFFVWSCTSNAKKENENTDVLEISENVADNAHSAMNSLDYMGTYKGTLPCADCDSIETAIVLNEKDYIISTTLFKNGKTASSVEKGTYSWNDAGNTITLDSIKNAPNKYFVGENTLRQLDMDGNKIEGNLADMYVLKKVELIETSK